MENTTFVAHLQSIEDMHTSDSIVIIPTYNERENIENIIRAVFALEHGFHILVIEDGSPDGTAEIVRRLQREEFADRLFMVERRGKLGLGTAYIAGFRWALEHDYEYIFEMDADFSHKPRLYKACAEEGADVSIGSRYVSGVNVVNWPMGRVLMSYFASKYVRIITGLPIHDTTAGFVCYRRRAANHQPRLHPLQGLCLPDRDEVHRLQVRRTSEGSARHLHQPRAGHLENELQHLRRSRLRSHSPEVGQLVQEVS